MADNITYVQSPNWGTIPKDTVVATDDVSGVQYQIVKLAIGTDGSAVLLSDDNPLPITGTFGASNILPVHDEEMHTAIETLTKKIDMLIEILSMMGDVNLINGDTL